MGMATINSEGSLNSADVVTVIRPECNLFGSLLVFFGGSFNAISGQRLESEALIMRILVLKSPNGSSNSYLFRPVFLHRGLGMLRAFP